MIRQFFLKLRRRRRLHEDLEAELAFHRQLAAEHGNPIPLGNTTVIKEHALSLWRFTTLENFWRDIMYGVRSLRRSPALVFTALVSLALGIGVNTAVFSLGTDFLFSEPSVADARSIMSVRLGGNSHAKEDVIDFVRQSELFQDVAGENEESFVNWDDGAETRRVFCVYTTKNYFTSLGVPMACGRGYTTADPKEVVVLEHQFWRTHFNGDPSVVGRAIRLNGKAYTIVGVLPAGHRTLIGFGVSPEVYAPRFLDGTVLAMYARLKPGMSIGEARAGLEAVARRLDAELPQPWKSANSTAMTRVGGFARVQDQREMLTIGIFFAMVLAIVALVLLIACVNVASLLLARASTRHREIAIRASLGATRARIFQQLFVESLLLSLCGTALGLLVCSATSWALGRVHLPLPLPIRLSAPIDWRVALYAAFLAIFATVASGLIPAWRSMKVLAHSDFARRDRLGMRHALVTAQVATCVIVLATGMLFLRNLLRSSSIDPGFDVQHTLRAEVTLPPLEYKTPARMRAYVNSALNELRTIPGIQVAAAARIVPFTDTTRMGGPLLFPDTNEEVHMQSHWNAVTPGYFEVMGIPILFGRTFSDSGPGQPKLVVINRTFARRYLGKRDPVGAQFRWGPENRDLYEIVGVVEGTKNLTIGEDPQPQMYVSLAQVDSDRTRIQFVLRSATPPATQLDAVRQVLRRLEPGAGAEVATMYSSIGLAILPSQIGAAILGSLGVLGLILAMIGLYGVMVYAVASRTREIGVRMALGATRSGIGKMILLEAVKVLGVGSAIGIFIALFVTRPLAMFLAPGVKPSDPTSHAAVIAFLAIAGLLATWAPVRRATAVDPAQSLRYD